MDLKSMTSQQAQDLWIGRGGSSSVEKKYPVVNTGNTGIDISLCVCVWNTSHLLKRSVQTYLQQDIDPARWELIVIDDSSQDDVQAAIKPLLGKINVRYVRLDHSDGMRGNTVAFNTAFGMAKGSILAETTAECMLPRDALRQMIEPHKRNKRCFVALKTYNLLAEMQIVIDQVDWESDIMNISAMKGWKEPWVQNNVATTHFGTHQICSIRKDVWFEITKGVGFPLYGDYGSEDPWYAGLRAQKNVLDITLPNSCMAVHQWHPPFPYWMAKGRGPRMNRFAHSMSNYLNDKSGIVPDGGTCMIWDGGSHEQFTEEEKKRWKTLDEKVIATGMSREIVDLYT